MNFGELRFWELLFAGLAVVLGLRWVCALAAPSRLALFDKCGLLSLGLFLLLCVSWITFAIFLVVALTTYAGLSLILKRCPTAALKWLPVLVGLQVLPLFFFKYADFTLNQVLGAQWGFCRGLLIPVGISFYTFQKVAFVVDVLVLRQPLPRFLDYMNFAGFFPQIVAGPIERKANLLPQMENFRFRWSPTDLNEGASWLAVGLFMKCGLADNLAQYFDGNFSTNPFLLWKANVLFGLRIYFDFAGYSLVAVGVARCFGVRLTLNFRSPYCATSVGEFWRRWHITLSEWFRDYLYIPLGGGRTRRWAFNLAVVFIVSGVWHGAGWNFVIWGALHAGLLIASRVGRQLPAPAWLTWALTMLGVFFAWMSFYETNTLMLLRKMSVLLQPSGYTFGALRAAVQEFASPNGIVLAFFLGLTLVTLLAEWLSVRRREHEYAWLRHPLALCILVVLTVELAPGKNNAFIYFAF
ncbi:MAG: hypothetical protein RLZZ350_325 [Verrucomicrobiota bacterium]